MPNAAARWRSPPTGSPCATSTGPPSAKSSARCSKPNSLPQSDPSRRDAVLDFHLLGGLPSAFLDHDRISPQPERDHCRCDLSDALAVDRDRRASATSEEHTSELQSHLNLVCRLL